MEVRLTEPAMEDIRFFHKSGKKAIIKKIDLLITEVSNDPFSGIGKPEQLKHHLVGLWSRRITREHRFVYEVVDNIVFIISVKGHYY